MLLFKTTYLFLKEPAAVVVVSLSRRNCNFALQWNLQMATRLATLVLEVNFDLIDSPLDSVASILINLKADRLLRESQS